MINKPNMKNTDNLIILSRILLNEDIVLYLYVNPKLKLKVKVI